MDQSVLSSGALSPGRLASRLTELPVGIDSRAAAILREIVEQYVETGEPVGSRTLSRRLPIALSPATIRNVMADLTEAGLLFSPHTSAGRLPTEQGLRLFVDGLLQFGDLPEGECEAISLALEARGRSLEDTLAEASLMLSGLSAAAGLVLAPKGEGTIRHIEFVPLGPGRALVVLVTCRRPGREPRPRGARRSAALRPAAGGELPERPAVRPHPGRAAPDRERRYHRQPHRARRTRRPGGGGRARHLVRRGPHWQP